MEDEADFDEEDLVELIPPWLEELPKIFHIQMAMAVGLWLRGCLARAKSRSRTTTF